MDNRIQKAGNSQSSSLKKNPMMNVSKITAAQIKNPMELGPVISCIFSYLSVEEIKYFRTVCREWNAISKPILRAQSKVVIRQENLESRFRLDDCINSTFLRIFSSSPSVADLPFSAFKIENGNLWSLVELNHFFDDQRQNLKELEIDDINLTERWGSTAIEDVNVTHWLSNSPMTKPKAKYNTKLILSSDSDSRLAVDINVIAWIKELSLKHCNVNLLEDDIRLSPVNFMLDGVTFHRDGNIIPEVCVEDILNFSGVYSISLNSIIADTQLKLDLSRNAGLNLYSLTLAGITALNWGTSTWSVNAMVLYAMTFDETTTMNVKKLYFHISTVEIYALPQTLTKLIINCSRIIETQLTEFLNLPNLKFLYLNQCRPICTVLSHFVNCPSLTCLRIGNCSRGRKHTLELNVVPTYIKRLRLEGTTVRFRKRNKKLFVHHLVLDGYSFYDAINVIHSIKAKYLILNWRQNFDGNYEILNFLQTLKDDFEMLNVCVGPFYWNPYQLRESRLANYMNREAHYYVFRNLKGVAIDHSDFIKLMRFSIWQD